MTIKIETHKRNSIKLKEKISCMAKKTTPAKIRKKK